MTKQSDSIRQGIKTRAKIIKFITKYHGKYGCSPSLQEIAAGVGLASHNAVRAHLLTLRAAGVVTWVDGRYRTVRVLESA